MQNVLALAPAIAATSGFGSATGKGRTGMVDARDVAAVAAKIAAVAAVLSKLLGRTITYTELSFDENMDAMIRPASRRRSLR